ncbi:hypothetical protein [Nocardia aurantia]|uniref:Uncharacterized protein n=1 Tax=Nocardia aurantia TaxID=2585199 RepID=A0A7K0DRP2_9NOCA|nr:hypothetical protein [Nocardia aurantia]MQY28419.1 hypothetical protein [Nocardia aurantia]
MSHQPLADFYPRLPGPARFIGEILAGLRLGKSVVVVFPEAMVEAGVADAILHEIAAENGRAEYCDPSTEAFPTRILATFGVDPLHARDYEEWDTIIGWTAWHGSWVLIPGWQHHDVEEIVRRWPAQLNACGLSIEDRPKLVIAVRLADLPRSTITHLDAAGVAVHWWWGVLDRLDTEIRLSTISEQVVDPVDAAVIAELAGWDLPCVDHLFGSWDRTSTGLPDAVRDYRTESRHWDPKPAAAQRLQSRRGLTAPPVELEQLWRDGLVERWGRSIRSAPHALDDAEVARRMWMAHNRVLIPHVDEERTRFERTILEKASAQALHGLARRSDDIIEIGSLAWLVETRRVDIGSRDRQRLQTFRDLRNDLAHHKPVTDDLLRRVLDYLED